MNRLTNTLQCYFNNKTTFFRPEIRFNNKTSTTFHFRQFRFAFLILNGEELTWYYNKIAFNQTKVDYYQANDYYFISV
jgi:hypothetical protein